MARFFKFIFRVLLLAYIAVVLALVVPPLIGYTTATVMETSERNQDIGTVDYAKRIPLQDLSVGEKILVTGTDSVKVYTVQYVDVDQSMVTVADAESQQIPVRSFVYRLVLAVPFIGYIIIALQTMEGMIVLAMIALLLILLCVLTGIWSRKVKEKKRRNKEMAAEKAAEEKRAAEQAAREEARNSTEGNYVLNARAEAYFAARRAEQNKSASPVFEEYEDFPPKSAQVNEKKEVAKANAQKAAAEPEYFDEDEEDDETDFWLHDDVDDDDLFAGLNNKAATESLMATARLFAINRAAQLKEQMASDGKAVATDQTRAVSSQDMAVAKAQEAAAAAVASAAKTATMPVPKDETKPFVGEKKVVVKKSPVKEVSVDKVINLKELKELDEDTQQIVFTINIKVVSE